jgi:hypothetical protein
MVLGAAIIFLFLFSNLIDRILQVGASAVFFVLVGLAAAVYCISRRLEKWQYAVIGVAAFFSVFPLLKEEGLLVTVAATKDLAVPLSGILLGYHLLRQKRNLEILNCLYLPFVAYGLLQAWAFHTNRLDALLPWDATYVDQMQAAGKSVYQTDVLRFFGTLNSFFHYQLICLFVPILLWVRRDQLKSQWLLLLNLIFASLFLVISQERTPVAVLFILSLIPIIFGRGLARRAGWVGLAMSVTLVGIIGFFAGNATMNKSDAELRAGNATMNESDAELRMKNMATLQVDRDTSTKERVQIWREMLILIKLNNVWTGFSPAALLPGNEAWSNGRFYSPHNAYLFFVLAYGVVGLVLYFGLLARLIWSVVSSGRLDSEMRLFISGLAIAYLFLGFFHLSFLSKLGFLFCWILGLAMADRDGDCNVICPPCQGETTGSGANTHT